MNVAPYCSNIHHQAIDHIFQLIIEFNRSKDLDDTAIPHLTIFGVLKYSPKHGQTSQIQHLTCVAPVQRLGVIFGQNAFSNRKKSTLRNIKFQKKGVFVKHPIKGRGKKKIDFF